MVFLEIAMIVIGLAAVIYSVRISDNSGKVPKEDFDEPVGASREKEKKQLQEMLDSFTRKAETVYEDLDERMSQVSNEKIMGISEYSDQVIGKIEKNHDEVVFLFDMMNEKQEEVKKLVHEIDSLRADLHDESAREYQKMREQGQQLDEMKKSIELDILELQTGNNRPWQDNKQPDSSEDGLMDELPEANLEEDEFEKGYDAVLEDEVFDGLEDFVPQLEGDSFLEAQRKIKS